MIKAGARILIVEDEDLVSMLTEDMLDALGYTVSESAATLDAGLKVALTDRFDAAVLDVNLRGLLSFPIADILVDRGIPFMFITGYGAEGIDRRFAAIPVLKKPFSLQSLSDKLLETSS